MGFGHVFSCSAWWLTFSHNTASKFQASTSHRGCRWLAQKWRDVIIVHECINVRRTIIALQFSCARTTIWKYMSLQKCYMLQPFTVVSTSSSLPSDTKYPKLIVWISAKTINSNKMANIKKCEKYFLRIMWPTSCHTIPYLKPVSIAMHNIKRTACNQGNFHTANN